MKQVIWCEGIDGAGKSTLIKELTTRCNFPNANIQSHHFEFPLGKTDLEKYWYQYGQFKMMFDMLKEKYKAMKEMTNVFGDRDFDAGENDLFIFDRGHLGEYVWGPLYRKKFPMYLPKLEREYVDKINAGIVLVKCDPKVIEKRWKETRDEVFPDNLGEIQEMFEDALQMTPFPYIIVDSTENSAIQNANLVEEFMWRD